MIHYLMTLLLTASTALCGTNNQPHVAGNVSPATSAPCQESNDDSNSTGEVDEDIIITDDEYTNDDEGVNN